MDCFIRQEENKKSQLESDKINLVDLNMYFDSILKAVE